MASTRGLRILILVATAAVAAAAAWTAATHVAAPAPAGVAEARETPAPGGPGGQAYTIEQATSDRAQLTTIAFDALGFLTGSLGTDSFFPPGKVADFWGFQYLRDNDSSQMGHNTDFLTRAALDTYAVLTTEQRRRLTALAEQQVEAIDAYGHARFTLMAGFRRLLDGDLPDGATALDREAVMRYSAKLYRLDGRISYARARVMGAVLTSLSDEQRAKLDDLAGAGMSTWPVVQEPEELRGLPREEKVAVMTYSADLFSWYAGSLEADTYFCPERHGTYFGSFYLKDAPAVGNAGYSISTSLTGDMGQKLLSVLDARQATLITDLVEGQRDDLTGIVEVRRAVAGELRRFAGGAEADADAVAALMARYGRLDGDIAWRYATAFAAVGRTLTDEQRAELASLRTQMVGDRTPSGAYLYSEEIPMPAAPATDFLFAASGRGATGTSVSGVDPASACRGATVTISGAGFGTRRRSGWVRFGAVRCRRYFAWSAKRIRCRVPSEAPTGAVTVTVRAASGRRATASFTVEDETTEPFTLSSSAFTDGGTLPVEYSGDGAGISPPLAWSGVPDGTAELALMMTTEALDGEKWNWVLYGIPSAVRSLAAGSQGVGTAGCSSDGPELRYYPPMSKGPGPKTYTFTIYALSAPPDLDVPADQVTGPVLTAAIADRTLASTTLSVTYTRQ